MNRPFCLLRFLIVLEGTSLLILCSLVCPVCLIGSLDLVCRNLFLIGLHYCVCLFLGPRKVHQTTHQAVTMSH